MDIHTPVLDIEQSARAPEVVQKVSIDVQKIRIFAQASDDMLVPDLGQHRTARLSQCSPPPRLHRAGGTAANRRFPRLMFRHQSKPIKA
jgi:hypothetical protein